MAVAVVVLVEPRQVLVVLVVVEQVPLQAMQPMGRSIREAVAVVHIQVATTAALVVPALLS
jgi:hypothetical protein